MEEEPIAKRLRSHLDRDGYEVLRSWCTVPTLGPIKTEPIFNDSPGIRTDNKRKQGSLTGSWARSISKRLAAEYPFLTPSSMVLLESEPGCQRQAAHCDYIPTAELLRLDASKLPLLFLLAIEPNTTLDVWPGSHHTIRRGKGPLRPRKTVQLDAGDAIVFRADLVHAGSAYAVANRRVHVYLDSPVHARQPNRTWIIYKHAPTPIRAFLDER